MNPKKRWEYCDPIAGVAGSGKPLTADGE